MLPIRLKEKIEEHSNGALPLILLVVCIMIIALLTSKPAEKKEEINPVIQDQLIQLSAQLDRIEASNKEIYEAQITIMLCDLAEKGLLNNVDEATLSHYKVQRN